MKQLIHEIGKGYLSAIGVSLLSLTMAAIPKIPKMALGHEPTNTEELYIRAGLALFAVVIFGVAGWLLFLRERSRHPFQNDCEFDKRLGVYRHKSKAGFYCGSCTPKGTESPLKEEKSGWRCLVSECRNWHENPDYKHPKQKGDFGSPYVDMS